MCAKRPYLTELVLTRFLEVMDYDFEFVVCYDGDDDSYIKMIKQVIQPDVVVMNKRGLSQGELLNIALDKSSAEYYMHIENDWWWFDNNCIDEAMYAIDKYDFDIIRMVDLPYGHGTGEGCIKLKDVYMREIIAGQNMAFHFNPQLRKIKFPAGRFVATSNQRGGMDLESAMYHRWNAHPRDKYLRSWVLLKPYFRHIGFFSANFQPFDDKPKTLEEVYNYNFYGGTFHDLELSGRNKVLFDNYITRSLKYSKGIPPRVKKG